MPYQAHPAFIEPANRNARLWRYMDLPRLLSVLDNGALFFPSVATLSQDDPYEGEPALAKIRAAQARGADEIRRLQLQSEVFKHLNFFNCWHMNDGESDAMWKKLHRHHLTEDGNVEISGRDLREVREPTFVDLPKPPR